MAQQKRPHFLTIIFGELIMWSLPVIIFFVDERSFPFLYLYIALGVLICLPASSIASKGKNINGTLIQKILPILPVLIPFWILAAYPFSVSNFMVTIALVLFGLTLPLWNKYFTWWFYTLGGLAPLPEVHNWLIDKKNKKHSGEKYQNFMKSSAAFGVIIGVVSVSFTRTVGYSGMIIFMKYLSMLVIFSMALTMGADLKKKHLGL